MILQNLFSVLKTYLEAEVDDLTEIKLFRGEYSEEGGELFSNKVLFIDLGGIDELETAGGNQGQFGSGEIAFHLVTESLGEEEDDLLEHETLRTQIFKALQGVMIQSGGEDLITNCNRTGIEPDFEQGAFLATVETYQIGFVDDSNIGAITTVDSPKLKVNKSLGLS